MAEEKRKLSDTEQKLYDYLKTKNTPVAIFTIKEELGDNIVGAIGKLIQLELINKVIIYRVEKKYRKQVEIKKETE